MIYDENFLDSTLRLAPGVHLLMRSKNEFQLGINPDLGMKLPANFRVVFEKCSGALTVRDLAQIAVDNKFDFESTVHTLHALTQQGLLIQSTPELKTLTKHQASHLLDAQRATQGNSQSVSNRSKARISIYGAGRLGTTLALLLGNSGFSNLRIIDPNLVSQSDLIPWGASRIDVGQRRDSVVQTMLERIHQGQLKSARQKETRSKPTLVIYAPDPAADFPVFEPSLVDNALAADLPFIAIACSAKSVIVTAISTPGLSGCIRCFHLNQKDRDPAWPALISQLIGRIIPDPTPTDLILTSAQFAYQKITNWIDSAGNDDGYWHELNSAGRSRSFVNYPHSACGCFWQSSQNNVA